MTQEVITISRHILEQQMKVPGATGEFSRLLSSLALAAKIISREVNRAGLGEILGAAGYQNVQGEQVTKLDVFAHRVICNLLSRSGHVCIMASEESEGPLEIPDDYPCGKYVMLFDPLDGSSNIEINASIGTIFSIHKRITAEGKGTIGDCLQTGVNQVCAGYVVYGSSTMLVYTTGQGVHGFTLDPRDGSGQSRLRRHRRSERTLSQHFHVPDEASALLRESGTAGAAKQSAWDDLFARYRKDYPDLAAAFDSAMSGELPDGWDRDLPTFSAEKPLATRTASGAVLDVLAPRLPTLLGGSADLTPSNNTLPKGEVSLTRDDFSGRYIRFGVREHGMGSILNGLALHGGVRPYAGTFLIFSDYKELFDAQPAEYQEAVLPSKLRARVAVEAGGTLAWKRYVGLDGEVVGIDRFGASAPYQVIFEQLGLTAEAVAEAARRTLSKVE